MVNRRDGVPPSLSLHLVEKHETELLQRKKRKIFSDLITALISARKKPMQSDPSACERGREQSSFS